MREPDLAIALTDREGSFHFRIDPDRFEAFRVLVCAPGALPMVHKRSDGVFGGIGFQFTAKGVANAAEHIRDEGWKPPIPARCE